ncbi:succinyl-diaminopimelate desuccinylase [Salinibacillus kushneri]|uniref:Probable succinyl-diaminopimelate desuccinylase n=1 Tax=Salinibacillus kushneri TaxID=237682 RepID=A0A1H9ZCA4_9BACI|nr:M20 family metallopeptidase [Salinibacillus kushneri]SES79197.1 succinyl-diaminopimelate desuccinylase [Salinibacillus kushneri]
MKLAKKERLKRDYEHVVKLTQQLVRIPSVYRPEDPNSNEQKVASFVAGYLENLGIETYVEEVEPGRPNVIGVIDSGKPGKTLLFEGHTDVVTEGDHASWKYDPFGAQIVNGRMYGRGTNDTKGNLACMITAVQSLLEDQEEFTGKMILCIPVDEEGMMIGIKHFIKKGWADDVDGAIICEPEENQICIAQRGALRIRITVKGKQAHGAISWSGINPNWRMAKIITALEQLEIEEQKIHGEHEFLKGPSITPTVLKAPITGDAQINVIPESCMTTLDIRTVPNQDHNELLTKIQNTFTELKEQDENFEASLDVIEDRPPTETDIKSPVVQAVHASVKEVLGKGPVYNGVPGATDGTFLHLHGVPIVTIGAGDRNIPHQVNEYVELNELGETTEIYRKAALNFLRGISKNV